MLTRILHNSPSLCTFIEQLDLSLSQPQLQHVLHLADALLVCDSCDGYPPRSRTILSYSSTKVARR